MGDRASGRLDDAGRLMTEQEWELVVDAAVAVGQIGMAYPARLDPHDHVVRAGIRDGDVDKLDRRAFAARDDALDLLGHVNDLATRVVDRAGAIRPISLRITDISRQKMARGLRGQGPATS